MLKAVRQHTDCPWVLLYIERWLKAPVQMEDGSVVAEHREPCDSRGSCTVLGAPGGEIPPGDSTISTYWTRTEFVW
jgi:hypothetical protein